MGVIKNYKVTAHCMYLYSHVRGLANKCHHTKLDKYFNNEQWIGADESCMIKNNRLNETGLRLKKHDFVKNH